MNKMYFVAYFVLLSFNLFSCEEGSLDGFCLKDEFNISSYWSDGMLWEEFLAIRNELRRESLVKYLDKIEVQKMAKEVGLEVPKTYIASRDKVNILDIISELPLYVAKPTHLSCSEGLMIVKNGTNMLTGEPITPEKVQENLFKSLEQKPRDVESWTLHQVPPGFMIQEYVANRMEVKIQTIFGRAVIGEWRGGEYQDPWTPIWGRYDRNGNQLDGSGKAPEWWSNAIDGAEKMAKWIGADAIRVDFLVNEEGVVLLNEIAFWTETEWYWKEDELETLLNDGYRSRMKRDK